jgi:CRISPR-associated protein Csx3
MSVPLITTSRLELPAPWGPAVLIAFEIPGGVCTPEEFAGAAAALPREATCPPGAGVILSGRGPVWGFAMLAHLAHPSRWVATHDPRLGGAVVVQAHWPGVSVGDVVPMGADAAQGGG